jgi:predicted 3-demethylubiquinone-9 3-methyltransferase (glyoxalase superfamily)
MQKITPFLWYDNNAEEAVNFYLGIFENARILEVTRYTEVGPGPAGTVMTISFELEGQRFTALNGGPEFPFTDAVSFVVSCETQEEVDHYWDNLLAGGGHPEQCGWLRDRYGVPWQITPRVLLELIKDPDPARRNRVMQAMMKMVKLDIAALKSAAEG